jgi:hypothetical protein
VNQLGSLIAPTALDKGSPVLSDQGDEVGSVHVVLLDGEALDGLVIDRTVDPLGLAVVEAEEVKGVFERGVVLGLSTPACTWLAAPTPESDDVVDPRRGGVLRRAWAAVAGR